MLREIKGTQRLPRMLAISVDGTGTASIVEGSTDVSLTDNGTGDYTLTFAKALARTPVVVASPLTADRFAQIHTVSASAVTIKTFKVSDQTAADADFHVLLLGWDSPDAT